MVKKRKPWAYWIFNAGSLFLAVYLFLFVLPRIALPPVLLLKGVRVYEKWLLQHLAANVLKFYTTGFFIFLLINVLMLIFVLGLGFQVHLLERVLQGEAIPANKRERLTFLQETKPTGVFVLLLRWLQWSL